MNIDFVLGAHGVLGGGRRMKKEVAPPATLTITDLIHRQNGTISWSEVPEAELGYRYKVIVNDVTVLEQDTLGNTHTLDGSLYNAGDSVRFEVRVRRTDTTIGSDYKASRTVTVAKIAQAAPAAPNVSNITKDSATVTSVPGAIVRMGSGEWFESPHVFTGLTPETQYTAYAMLAETATHYASEASVGVGFKTRPDADDLTGAPGPKNLIAGDMQAGFFGEVAASELITGDALALLTGVSGGTSQNSNEPWLKFAYLGKVQFVAKKAFRRSIGWHHINGAGVAFGKAFTVGNLKYTVRLLRGANKNPTNDMPADYHNSEWNRLMLPIHQGSITKSWTKPEYVESNIPSWNHSFGSGQSSMYSDADIEAKQTWCQEATKFDGFRLYRGGSGISYALPELIDAGLYWRPVLEVVEVP